MKVWSEPERALRWLLLGAVVLFCLAPAQRSMAFALQGFTYLPHMGSPTYIPNFVAPEAGCSWAGIGGQVFNRYGRPQDGLKVRIQGKIGGVDQQFDTTSGSSTRFGPGGFEVRLANQALNLDGLSIQIFDANGVARSPRIPLRLMADCRRNLTVINFLEVNITHLYHLPVIAR